MNLKEFKIIPLDIKELIYYADITEDCEVVVSNTVFHFVIYESIHKKIYEADVNNPIFVIDGITIKLKLDEQLRDFQYDIRIKTTA